MFYFIVNRLPIISNVEDGKFLRIFIIGTICYIILHAFLYSNYNSGSELIERYRSYLYYIWAADLALTGILIKLFGNSAEELDDEDEYDEQESELVYNAASKINNQKMSPDEIKKRLVKINKHEKELNSYPDSAQQSSPSPFIKKDQSSKKTIDEINEKLNEKPTNIVNSGDNKLEDDKHSESPKNATSQSQSQNQNQNQNQENIDYSDTELPLYNTQTKKK